VGEAKAFEQNELRGEGPFEQNELMMPAMDWTICIAKAVTIV
jgi:hypothetical protein